MISRKTERSMRIERPGEDAKATILVVVAVVVVVIILAAIMVIPTKADEVNSPSESTIAWVKVDAQFKFSNNGQTQEFEKMTVSKGEYVGDGTDLPTFSIWETLTLGGGHYLWQFDFIVTAPDGKVFSMNVTQAHDLPKEGSIADTMGILYVSSPGTYNVVMKLRAIDYQKDATGEVLALGTDSFTIPVKWTMAECSIDGEIHPKSEMTRQDDGSWICDSHGRSDHKGG